MRTGQTPNTTRAEDTLTRNKNMKHVHWHGTHARTASRDGVSDFGKKCSVVFLEKNTYLLDNLVLKHFRASAFRTLQKRLKKGDIWVEILIFFLLKNIPYGKDCSFRLLYGVGGATIPATHKMVIAKLLMSISKRNCVKLYIMLISLKFVKNNHKYV